MSTPFRRQIRQQSTPASPPSPAIAAIGLRAGGLLFAALLGTAGSLSVGCGTDAAKPATTAAPAGLAILGSDFAVTTISLYNPATGELMDGCLHSGSTSAVLKQPLSGDVALPSEAQPGGELVVIDRKNAALIFVDPTTCVPRAQISVSTGGFKANPRDIITVSTHKAYVTRYETNDMPTADAGDFDDGDDLVVIDPHPADPAAQPVLKRIGLSSYASPVNGAVIQARPDRGVFAAGKVYVTLGNLDAKFSAAGAGRVVAIDPASDAVTETIDLPPSQKGCSAITYVAATNRLYVSCGGAFSDADQTAGSGLVEIDLTGTTPTSKVVVAASDLGTLPLNFSYAAVLGEVAFVGTLGTLDFSSGAVIAPDAFYAVGLGGGGATKLLDGGAFNFGRAAIAAAQKKVFLPDGDTTSPTVHVFDASIDPPVATGMFEANPSAHLPPREIAWY